MEEFVYNAIQKYFTALSKVGYYKYKDVYKLLVLIFYYHLIYEDYRGYVKKEDYRDIEKALNCLYGTSCLIPYMDYLKMGKIKLGEMTEILSRLNALSSQEDEIAKLSQLVSEQNTQIEDNTRRVDEQSAKVITITNSKVVKGKTYVETIQGIPLQDGE